MNEDILAQLGQGQPAPAEEPKEEIKYKDKKKSSGKQIDDEVLTDLLMNGDNTKGMITPSEKDRKKANDDEELHEEPDEDAKLKGKGNAKPYLPCTVRGRTRLRAKAPHACGGTFSRVLQDGKHPL